MTGWPGSNQVVLSSLRLASGPYRSQGGSLMQAGSSEAYLEEVVLEGHIIDSLILSKVLDEILTHGGAYEIKETRIGRRQTDPSYARIEVRAGSAQQLQEVLAAIHEHGAVPKTQKDCQATPA